MTNNKLQDKRAITQVFAGIMAQPDRLKNKEYKLVKEDFPETFHKIIYAAMFNIQLQGAQKISAITIDSHLSVYTDQYRIFQDNQGLDYLLAIEETGEPENFNYHYQRVKKFSLLRECVKNGLDISDIYDTRVVDLKEEKERNDKFNEASLEDMIKHIESKMINIKDQFLFDQNSKGSHMADNIEEIIDAKMESPSYGLPFQSGYLNTVTRGMRLGKLYCVSGDSGSGKTRTLLSMVLSATVPEIYDIKNKKWVKTGATGSGLFISTELEESEVKIPAICFIAGIDETKINDANLTTEEQERISRAVKILSESKMWFEELHDFDIEDLEHVITKHINKNDVTHVAFDYIHTTLKLFESMGKRGAKGLQEHQVLRILTIYLKNICKDNNIWMGTATQLNEKFKEDGNMDKSALEGSKSIVNKLDFGAIQLRLTAKDQAIIDTIMQSGIRIPFGLTPTHTINVYKNRGNRWELIRVFVHFDTGTLRTEDVFVTTYEGVLVSNITPRKIKYEEVVEPVQEEQYDSLPDSFGDELPNAFNAKSFNSLNSF